jgi:hypothetical protein
MKIIDLSSAEERSRTVLRVIATVSLIIILLIVIYALVTSLTEGPGVIGSNLVNIEFPSPSISPIYFKPITIMYMAAALLLYTGLELGKERVRLLSSAKKTLIKAFSFIVAVVFFFELAYNFVYWSGQIAAESIRGTLNPDLISNPFPSMQYQINVVFAARLFAIFLIAGAYVFYFMTKLERENQAQIAELNQKP